MSFSAIADAQNALGRLYGVFNAELLTETKVQDPTMDVAVRVEHGDFTWDAPPPEVASKGKKSKKQDAGKGKDAKDAVAKAPEKVFSLKDINMEIPKGQLTAIVGPVGTGKTSLLEALIGEMRRTSGTVKFQGSVAYCPQSAWIQVISEYTRIEPCIDHVFTERNHP